MLTGKTQVNTRVTGLHVWWLRPPDNNDSSNFAFKQNWSLLKCNEQNAQQKAKIIHCHWNCISIASVYLYSIYAVHLIFSLSIIHRKFCWCYCFRHQFAIINKYMRFYVLTTMRTCLFESDVEMYLSKPFFSGLSSPLLPSPYLSRLLNFPFVISRCFVLNK